MSLLGIFIILIMVGVYVLVAIKLIPSYIEYRAVRSVVIRVAKEYDRKTDTSGDIRRSLSGYLNTNQVKSINYRDIKLRREDDNKLMIDANYENRVPLFWRIDLVMRYEDLVFEAGVDYSDD